MFSREALAKGYKEEFLTATGVSIKRNDGSLIDKFYGYVEFFCCWHIVGYYEFYLALSVGVGVYNCLGSMFQSISLK